MATQPAEPMVRLTRAQCIKCGQFQPQIQFTPEGNAPFGTPVPARWLEDFVRNSGSTHNGGCGPVQFEMEPWRASEGRGRE